MIDNYSSVKSTRVFAKSLHEDAKCIEVYAKSIFPTSCPRLCFRAFKLCVRRGARCWKNSFRRNLNRLCILLNSFAETPIDFAELYINFNPVFRIKADFSYTHAHLCVLCECGLKMCMRVYSFTLEFWALFFIGFTV